MAEKTRLPREASEVISSIEEKASQLRQGGSALDECIIHFQKYLGSMKGRVEATYITNVIWDWNSKEFLALKFHRENKEWKISYGWYIEGPAESEPDYDYRWDDLIDASMRIKMFAIERFPNLLEQIEESQEKLVNGIVEVVHKFQTFAKTLPTKEGK